MLKKYSKRTYILASVVALLLGIIILSIRASFAAGDIYTKEELQDVIVGTGLSFLYNHDYTEYDLGYMDITPTGKRNNNTSTLENTFSWQSYEESPEDINRGHYYVSMCSKFTSNVNMKAIDFDASDYFSYNNSTYTGYRYYFNGTTYKDVFDSTTNYKNGIKYLGKGGTILDGLSVEEASQYEEPETGCNGNYDHTTGQIIGRPFYDNCATNKTPFVFYYKVHGTETEAQKKAIINTLKKVLQKGDVLGYRYNKSENTTHPIIGDSGHTLMYVGDSISSDTGLIHSTGYYFQYNDDGTLYTSGDDNYAVRYNGMDQYFDKLFINTESQQSAFISVYRPVNVYCNGTDNRCTLELTDNQKARANFSKLRIEQYASENKEYSDNLTTSSATKKSIEKTLSKYASVNHGDIITYNLYLKNMSNYEFCTKSTSEHTAEKCESLGYTWNTGDKVKTYNNVLVSGEIPSNTTYVDYKTTCKYNNESYNCSDTCAISGGKINCSISTIAPGREITITYRVKVSDNASNSIVNNGMTVSNSNNTLTLGKINTRINPTFNGINQDILNQDINKLYSHGTNGFIEYTDDSTTDYKKDIDSLSSTNKAVLPSSGIPKMLYYNQYNIDLEYLTGANVKAALFNAPSSVTVKSGSSSTSYTVSNFYTRKTTEQTASLTNSNYKKINNMLVDGLYGGRRLYGNDRYDRPRYFKYNDLEVGDIIVTFNNNATTTSWYTYSGLNANGEPSIRYLKDNGKIWRTYLYSNRKDEVLAYSSIIYTADLFAVFRPMQEYGTTVKYNYNGATEIGDSSYVTSGKYLYLNTPKKDDYRVTYNYNATVSGMPSSNTATNTFAGWYSDTNLTNKVTNETNLVSTNTHTINAKWNTESISLPKPTRNGYHFAGWYENNNKIENPNNYVPTQNTTLKAKWTELPEVGITMDRTANGVNLSIIAINGTADGYEIYKYNDTSDNYDLLEDTENIQLSISHNFSENNSIKIYVKPYIMDGNQKIYGKDSNINVINEEMSRITVSYIGDEHGQVTGDVTQILNIGESPVAVLVSPEVGYRFSNWTVDKDVTLVSGSSIQTGNPLTSEQVNSISVNSNIVIKANFVPITYEVTYSAGSNGEITGKTSENVLYNQHPTGTTLRVNEGYVFKNWTANKDIIAGSKTITAGNPITNQEITTAILNSDTIFTANIEKLVYTVNYTSDSHGRITGVSNERVDYNNNPTGTTISSDNGYEFYRWQINNNVELNNGTSVSTGSYITTEQLRMIKITESITVKAINNKINYTIKYISNNLGSITGSTEETVAYYEHPSGATIEAAEGYMFDYWIANKDIIVVNDPNTIIEGEQNEIIEVETIIIRAGEPISEEQLANIVVEDSVTFTANYKELSYKITLDNGNATKAGTAYVYEVYDEGIYLDDKDKNTNLTTNNIVLPEKRVEINYYYSYGNYKQVSYMTFDGYYSERNGQGEKLIDSNGRITTNFYSTKFNKDSTIYANWLTVYVNLYKPTVQGYIFGGWYSDTDLEHKVGDANENYAVNRSLSLYGKWVSITYQIEYNANGGTGQMANTTHETGVTKALSSNQFTRTGYHFIGWSTDPNATTPTYNNNQKVINLTYEESAVVKLYAVWEENDDRLYIDVNVIKGDVDYSTKSVTAGGTVVFNISSDQGYNNPTVVCSNNQNASISESTLTVNNVTDSATCTVTFNPITYNIRYNANGATGTMTNSIHKYDEDKQLTKNSFIKNGYRFAGWSEEPDSRVIEYRDESNIRNLTYEDGNIIDLYASWEILNYRITYNLMGGEANNPNTYNINTDTFTLNNPTKEGYTFAGWTENNGATPNNIITISKGTTGDKTYTANWNVNSYTITFDSNGGSSVNPITKNYGEEVTKPENPTKEDFRFAGWYSDRELTRLYSFGAMPSRDITLYAKWAEKEYIINYELDGGINSENNSTVYEYGSSIILNNPTKTGYRFAGWYLDEGYNDQISSIDSEMATDITLYAKWEIEKYKIILKDANSGETNEIEVEYNDNIPNIETPTKTGYRFTGWYEDSSHTNIFNDTTMPASNVVLYAGWEINKYTITFNSNGGSKINSIEEDYNTKIIEPSKPVKEGYKFSGWYSDKELTQAYRFTTMPAENLTLYAKWTRNSKTHANTNTIVDIPDTGTKTQYIAIIAGILLIASGGYLVYKKHN